MDDIGRLIALPRMLAAGFVPFPQIATETPEIAVETK